MAVGQASSPNEYSVIICGGGPVGLVLALELGRRGIDCCLVERRDGVIRVPKMNLVHVRSMEHIRRLGFEQQVRDAGWPHDYPLDVSLNTGLHGFEIIRSHLPSDNDRDDTAFTPSPLQRCPQMWFDPIVLKLAQAEPNVDVRLLTEMTDFAQDGDGVTCTVRRTAGGETQALRGKYLVACEGAMSKIRERLGIGLLGSMALDHNMNFFFRSENFVEKTNHGRCSNYFELGPRGIEHIFSPIDGKSLWRLGARCGENDTAENYPANDLIRRLVGPEVEFELLSVVKWTRREVVADLWRVDRIFLAGDSAHQLTPNGGQGMNTGICDAVDLAWKLEAVLKGYALDGLLNTYDIERRPVADTIVRNATSHFRKLVGMPTGPAIADDSPEGAAMREAVARFCREIEVHFLHESEGLQLNVGYHFSPTVIADDSPPIPLDVAKPIQNARPGSRAPHAWLSAGKSTLDLFGWEFVLLQFGKERADNVVSAAGDRQVPLSVHQIDDPKIAELYAARLVLVRPDGYVAWRGNNAPDDAVSFWSQILGDKVAAVPRQTSELVS